MTGNAPTLNSTINACRARMASAASKWILCKDKFLHDSPADQMHLDDSLQHFGRAGVVPNRFRIHDGDWSLGAHAQAIHFASIDQWLRPGQVEFFQPPLQIFPRLQAFLY